MNKTDLINQVSELSGLSKRMQVKQWMLYLKQSVMRYRAGTKFNLLALVTLRCASVKHAKAVTHKQVKKSKLLQAKSQRLSLVSS